MNGSTTGVTIVGSLLTANYSAVERSVAARTIHRRALPGADCCGPSRRHDSHEHRGRNVEQPSQTASASVSIDIGGVPGVGTLNGTAWLDANFNKIPDTGEPLLQGWTVALFLNGVQLQSVLTDVNGVYRFAGVTPTDGTSNRYELRFTAPGAGPNTAKLGKADSAFTNSLQRITNIAVPAGSNLQNLNLPIAPNGVVYNSTTRTPIAGMTAEHAERRQQLAIAGKLASTIRLNRARLPRRAAITVSTSTSRILPAPAAAAYVIKVTAPSAAFVAGESKAIPAASDAATAPFSVPTCPGGAQDALPAVPFCEAQGSEFAPAASVPPRSAGTKYYLNLTLDGSQRARLEPDLQQPHSGRPADSRDQSRSPRRRRC